MASHSTSMESGTTSAVSHTIGSERASAPRCQDTPIWGISSKGVFSSSYCPNAMDIQSTSLRDEAAAHVDMARRASATPMQMFLDTFLTCEALDSGRRCGSAIRTRPTSMGASARIVSISRSPPMPARISRARPRRPSGCSHWPCRW